jgi:chorismate mutase
MESNGLGWWRKQVDSIDQQLLKLLVEREQVVKAIAAIKVSNGTNVLDEKREGDVIQSREILAEQLGLCRNFAKQLMYLVMKNSKDVQEKFIEEVVARCSKKKED